MAHPFHILHDVYHTVVDADRVGVDAIQRAQVLYLYMIPETHHLVAYGMLESKHHAYGNDHHSQSDGHSNGGYMNCRTTYLAAVALVIVNTLGYE